MPYPSDGNSHSSPSLDSSRLQPVSSLPTPQNRLRLEEPIVNPWRNLKSTVRKPYIPSPVDHAAPFSSLPDRDLEIMAEWFDREDMSEIENEINFRLGMMYPEPLWEDDLSFLKDHL